MYDKSSATGIKADLLASTKGRTLDTQYPPQLLRHVGNTPTQLRPSCRDKTEERKEPIAGRLTRLGADHPMTPSNRVSKMLIGGRYIEESEVVPGPILLVSNSGFERESATAWGIQNRTEREECFTTPRCGNPNQHPRQETNQNGSVYMIDGHDCLGQYSVKPARSKKSIRLPPRGF
ncbi:hypothetical protein B296_00027373 [Ensete ventricosum]|uniref:Uncharacterized protein n=1 Tax=Ensete ventricosum TaxID=4639 RepID=A0A427APS7_ENSVE|nr:hypothetical protein B296_00027373 [Ensete ventricosum]